ncbi:MBL fold metallo-hydrolase [Halomonas beimenensis]|uniref:Dihydropteroate synthase n=1 Tax=Halomonas beimenensis TaxID=475662 RepID=A0A291PA92_9GAMM|nr:MBL fold metallo-hydrolase [Halomonas beimenensis]ATJ83787.1 dihydropteroate synthase [Halomonas beimenensis]
MTRETPSEGVVPLDELEVLVVVDNETDTLSSIDEGVPQRPEVAGLIERTPPSRHYQGHACKTVFDRLCCACHGFSALLIGRRDGREHRLLFDVGPYPGIWLDNAERLALDPGSIEGVFLSHWHFDHSGGLPEVIAAIRAARDAAGAPPPLVDLHPDRPDQRGALLPSGTLAMLPADPTFEALDRAGGRVVTHGAPHPLCEGFFLGSGEIARVTDYETGLPGHHSFHGERGEPDPWIMDERFVAAWVRGRGVSVFSACSHAGIVNACLTAQDLFPGLPLDLVHGGYHLAGKGMEKRIAATVHDLETRIRPRLVAPGHCTGWRAKMRLAEAFGPGHYAPSLVGSVYRLTATS